MLNIGNNSNNMSNSSPTVTSALQMAQAESEVLTDLISYNAEADKFKPALFRDKELHQVLSILTMRDHPNVLLTGAAGVGKTAIPQELARRLVQKDPLVTNVLGKDTVIYELPLSNLIAGKSVVGELEEEINNIIDFVSNPKNHALLYIDEIHQLFKNSSGTYDTIAQILKPALARSDMHVIASTTTQEAKFLKKDSAFSRRFTEVTLPEFTKDQMAQILIKLKPIYEKFHHISFNDKDALKIVQIAHQYNSSKHDPDLTLSLVDRAMADYNLKLIESGVTLKNPVISAKIFKNTAHKVLAPNFNNNSLTTFNELIKNNFIGQEKAIDSLRKMLKSISLDLIEPKKPHSALFAGPTGVGKTELAKLLAKAVFGSSKTMIYLNMTEYTNPMSVTKLLGASDGYVGSDTVRSLPFDSLETNPYQVVVLDEFEKAHPQVQQLLMQALDEGELETSQGQIINFKHTIMIATTNAGTHNTPHVGFSPEKDDEVNNLKSELPLELLNRFETIVQFDSLSKEQYSTILKIKYNQLAKAIYDHSHRILKPDHVDMNENYDFISELTNKTYNPNLNGRPAEREIFNYIQSHI